MLPNKLQYKLDKRIKDNALRELKTIKEGIDFYSNDYLGFAQDDEIYEQAHQLLQTYPYKNGSTGSRLISGTHPLHQLTENHIANFHQAEATLLYNSGYDANLGFFSAVPQKGDVVLYDELIHASIRDGMRLSMANTFKFKHNQLDDLKTKLDKHQAVNAIYITVESVYSMDGDSCPLIALVELAKTYNNVYLVVDEAHATGVFGNGKGLVCELGLEKYFFARIHTFGKAMGCHGAVVLGSEDLKNYLVNFSRSLIYSTAISVHTTAVIFSSYQQINQKNNIHQLLSNISYFCKRLNSAALIKSNSAIQCVLIKGNNEVKHIEYLLSKKGMNVKAVLSPTVKKGEERLRICLHAFNTQNQIDVLVAELHKVLKK